MGKIIKALMLIGVVFLFSCSNKKNYNVKIIGTWELVSLEPKSIETSDDAITAQIKADLSYEATSNDRVVLKFEKNGESLYIIKTPEGDNKLESTYTIKNDFLTINNKLGAITYRIEYLDNDKLKLSENITDDYQEVYKVLNQNATIKDVVATMIFSKSKSGNS